MSKLYHPVTGDYVDINDIKDSDAFIDDRLFKPERWELFYLEGEEEEGLRTYGIEVELNMTDKSLMSGRTKVSVCKALLAVLNRDGKHFHIMRDGSVRNGIELVSAPMTYNYFMQTFDFDEINELIQDLGLIATHDTGLHIHVGMDHSLRDRLSLLKLFSITYPLWIVKSRRRIIRLEERYVSTNYMITNKVLLKRHIANTKSLAKHGTSKVSFKEVEFNNFNFKNRYYAVNFTNESTVEFRYFAGTNNFHTVQGYLDFVDKFIKLNDDIANNKVGYVHDLDTVVKYADMEELAGLTSRIIKKIDFLYERDRLYYNHFYSFNTYWHQTTINEVITGDYVIARPKYRDYLKLVETAHKSVNRFSMDKLSQAEDYINELLLSELYEIVNIYDDTVEVCPVVYSTTTKVLNKSDFNSKYIALKPRNSALMFDQLEQ